MDNSQLDKTRLQDLNASPCVVGIVLLRRPWYDRHVTGLRETGKTKMAGVETSWENWKKIARLRGQHQHGAYERKIVMGDKPHVQ
jgi:hypothetical protein